MRTTIFTSFACATLIASSQAILFDSANQELCPIDGHAQTFSQGEVQSEAAGFGKDDERLRRKAIDDKLKAIDDKFDAMEDAQHIAF